MLKELYQIIRRRFYLTFRKEYVRKQLETRQGSCNHCSCCDMKFFWGLWDYNCHHYNKETKKCKIYNTKEWPYLCQSYPFDEKDKWDRFKDKCGFYWDE